MSKILGIYKGKRNEDCWNEKRLLIQRNLGD
jgi:hypothetical protein